MNSPENGAHNSSGPDFEPTLFGEPTEETRLLFMSEIDSLQEPTEEWSTEFSVASFIDANGTEIRVSINATTTKDDLLIDPHKTSGVTLSVGSNGVEQWTQPDEGNDGYDEWYARASDIRLSVLSGLLGQDGEQAEWMRRACDLITEQEADRDDVVQDLMANVPPDVLQFERTDRVYKFLDGSMICIAYFEPAGSDTVTSPFLADFTSVRVIDQNQNQFLYNRYDDEESLTITSGDELNMPPKPSEFASDYDWAEYRARSKAVSERNEQLHELSNLDVNEGSMRRMLKAIHSSLDSTSMAFLDSEE